MWHIFIGQRARSSPGSWILSLKMDLILEFSFYSHFEIAPRLFERIARQSCAFCNRRKDLVAMLEEQLQIRQVYSWCTKLPSASITSHSHLHTSSRRFNESAIAPRASQQDLSADCKTRNFVAQFAQINRAQFQNVNKMKILVLNPSSRVGFERPFKTASSELRKFKTGQCL